MVESEEDGIFPTEEACPAQTAPMSPKDPTERGVPILLTNDWLAQARRKMKERDLTQVAVALATGLSEPSISRLFKNNASTVIVAKVAEFLGLDDPGAQLLDPEIQQYVYVGVQLRKMNAAGFRKLLAKLSAQIEPLDDLIDAMTRHEK